MYRKYLLLRNGLKKYNLCSGILIAIDDVFNSTIVKYARRYCNQTQYRIRNALILWRTNGLNDGGYGINGSRQSDAKYSTWDDGHAETNVWQWPLESAIILIYITNKYKSIY